MAQFLLIIGAGLLGGAMNALAGGGSFVTLPALLAMGLPSVQANASSTVALFPGGAVSAWAYRDSLDSVATVSLRPLLLTTLFGGVIGALLLLRTAAATFDAVLPWLILLATLALAFGRQVGEMLRRRWRIKRWLVLVVQGSLGEYGGYFGALGVCAIASLAHVARSAVETSADKYSVKVPGGLAFSDFKGYESWKVISSSESGGKLAIILGNPIIIKAYEAGIPSNGQPFPEGAKIAKIHWSTKKRELFPAATVPDAQLNADFMEKDSKRFSDSNGWGYAAFEYDNATDKFRPATTTDMPAQANDAKCGAACHTLAKVDDYVFTEYAKR